jgi:Tfp pilus assembly protein PilF
MTLLAARPLRAIAGPAVAACVAALPYLQTLWFGFVNYDDPIHVTENPAFFPVSWSSLTTFWMRPYGHLYVPASYMLFAAECGASRWLHGDGPTAAVSPWIFHAVSVVLHVFSALLVVRILRHFTSLPWAAVAGGVLFAAHPLQVESVAWVAEQRGLLAAVFSLLAVGQFLAWVNQDRERSPLQTSYLVAIGALVVALLAKPSAIVTPFLAFAVAFHRRSVPWHTLARALVPWAGLALAAAIVTRTVQPAELTRVDVPILDRPLIAGDAIAFYAGKIVMPTGLCVAYGRTPRVAVADATAPFLAGLVAIAFAAVILLPHGRAWRLPLVLFVIPLVPVLGFTPFVFQNHSTVADRYVYLAMLGPALAITLGIDRWQRARSTLLGRGLPFGATVAIAVVCLQLTWRQAGVWRDSRTLFSHALATGHDNAVAHNNLGLALTELGRPGDALPHLQRAVALRADDAGAWFNLGNAFAAVHDLPAAVHAFGRALDLDSDRFKAWNNLGIVLLLGGERSAAEAAWRQSLAIRPDFPDARLNLAKLLDSRAQATPGAARAEEADSGRDDDPAPP